jgi:hypothetical protein
MQRLQGMMASKSLILTLIFTLPSTSLAQWVGFDDQTATRLSAEAGLGALDPEEKDYAFGDVDRDGDLDLLVARKEPFTTHGKRINVLFVNQDGVLTDRTADFAVDSDVAGDLGFLTPTNDRDITLADVNNDGWLDAITATALSSGDATHIVYPRVYMNKCCSVGGCATTTCTTEAWLGFRFESARIPEMLTDSGQAGFSPCFAAVSAGDVTGDGYTDLYFTDYDSGCGTGDFNDKLLINQGASNPGFFTDVTETNFIGAALGFPVSGFGASGGIAKFNEDDVNDVLKQYSGFVGLAYNMPENLGTFDKDNGPNGYSIYFVNHGDLNNDGKLDLVVSDDGSDRFLLNQGDDAGGMAEFLAFTYSFSHSGAGGPAGDSGFGGNNVAADLNNDGDVDVLITDLDVDVGGCSRRMHIYKNLGGPPGGDRVLEEQTTGSGCQDFLGHPSTCIVTTIPASQLTGTHDVAVFDIDGDGWKDMVVGRCSGTEVYRNVPPVGPAGGVPDGAGIAGTMLTVSRSGQQITLSWGASCSAGDGDYSVYEGTIGNYFQDHAPRVCSTGGLTSYTLSIGIGSSSAYYLVAPRNDTFLGSLGQSSAGVPRSAGESPCLPQWIGSCE